MKYGGAVKSLARPGRKQANVSVRMAWISFGALPCRETNFTSARVSILLKSRASLTCFRACLLPGQAKDLSAFRYLLFLIDFNRTSNFLDRFSNYPQMSNCTKICPLWVELFHKDWQTYIFSLLTPQSVPKRRHINFRRRVITQKERIQHSENGEKFEIKNIQTWRG